LPGFPYLVAGLATGLNPVPQSHGQSRKEATTASKVLERTCTRDNTTMIRKKVCPASAWIKC